MSMVNNASSSALFLAINVRNITILDIETKILIYCYQLTIHGRYTCVLECQCLSNGPYNLLTINFKYY